MDRGRSKGEDFQFQFLGPPPTPFREPIRPEMRENERNQVNWLGLQRNGPGFAQGGEAGVDISSWSGLNGIVVHDLEAASAGKEKIVTPGETPGIRIEQPFDGMECNMPFGDLLALADAASTEGFHGAAGRSFFSFPNRSASMLLPTTNIGLGSNFQSNGNYTSQNNVPAHHQCTYDLNFPPGTIGNAVSSMGISQFAPPTPAKVGGAENNDDLGEENLHANEKGQEENEWLDANRLQGPSQPDTDSSVLAVSTELKDNQNSEEGDQIVELLKTPQQKPRRRKHRPKVVREDKPKQTPKPVTPKPAASNENIRVKRKYVRKKVVIKPTTPPAEVNGDPADPKTLEPTRNSCRRALKFNSQGQQQDESSTHRSTSNLDSESRAQDCDIGGVQSKSSAEVAQGIELIVEITQADIAYDRTISVSQTDRQDQCTSFQIEKNTSQETLDVGKDDQVTVHDKHEDAAKSMMKNSTESAPRSPNDSNSCTSAVVTEEVKASRSKRKYTRVVAQASNTNRTGAHYNSLQAYGSCLLFPNIYKKKRSEKGQNSVAYSTSCLSEMKNAMEPPKTYPFAPKANYWNSASQLTTGGVPAKLEREDFEDKHQTMECLLAFPQHERLTKRGSKNLTHVCDLASLNKRAECQMQPTYSAKQGIIDDETQRVNNLEQSHKCLEALVADMQPTLAKRKRSKMKNFLTSSASYCTDKKQLHQQMVLYKYQQSFHKPSGARPKVIWQDFVDAVTEQFKYLDINREWDGIIYQERNALVPSNEDHNALVLYRSDGTIVPFHGPFDPTRKRRPRPKVELDDETNRVWRLLLENINNEGIDGTDEEKRKWWEEERRVFRGRADSFIARMHLVQGDRRFSRWKGSVVDSVIGVFLTQNVSDHLSSSAFMSLAARYPLKSERDHNPFQEEATLLVKEPEVCILDSEQTIEWKKQISNQPVCDQSSMTLHESEHNEEKEVVNSNVSPVINTVDTSLMDKTKCSSLNSSESDVEIYHASTTRIETASFAQNRATNDAVSSQNSVNSSQNTTESSIAQTAKRVGSYLGTNSENEENIIRLEPNNFNCLTSFTELLKMAGSTMLHEVSSHRIENVPCDENSKDAHSTSEQSILTAESASQETIQEKGAVTIQESLISYSENNQSSNLQGDENIIIQSQNWFVGDNNAETLAQEQNNKVQKTLNLPNLSGETLDVTESTISAFDNQRNNKQKTAEDKALKEINAAKQKNRRVGREINHEFDWDTLRREAEANGKKREKTTSTMDSLDYEAVRCADVNEIAYTIKERGMNNMLAERIKAFLNRLVKDHGSIDLEWLRDISPDKAKEYLLSIRGLGLKSVECVRLLTLHHLAFPVDTNVGRIAVRLGWVPLQPLPESLQLHLLELYPVLESIQKYLWPRLCKLEQTQLYELHYQMITFGKVFCTKSKPNCNACPMRGECRHFASAFASARLALPAPAPEEKSIVSVSENTAKPDSAVHINGLPLPPPQEIQQLEGNMQLEASPQIGKKSFGSCEPIIEEPASPEPERTQDLEHDIEDSFYDDPDDIPTIKLNMEEFTQNLQNYMERNMELQEGEMSKALVALTPEAASIPTAKLKNVSRLRTEHQVYELPDSHPLLEGMDKREPDDPCSYLLAIWTPGETANSIQPPEGGCSYQELGKLCNQKTCFACNSAREADSQLVRGTLLIPCRTAMRGSFPLNGTYFQVNEVFADHDSSLNPIDVPRSWIWNLPRRTVYFGTSVPSIFKGLPTEGIQHCFWRGYVCVRGFDQKTRAPRPLMARLHFPASKLTKGKGKTVDE